MNKAKKFYLYKSIIDYMDDNGVGYVIDTVKASNRLSGGCCLICLKDFAINDKVLCDIAGRGHWYHSSCAVSG